FLLHTAVLSRLDARVCQAVTAAPERRLSQQMLSWLERANLFLVSLDEERRSYRLHELFREALLSALHTTHPEHVPGFHPRAPTQRAYWSCAAGPPAFMRQTESGPRPLPMPSKPLTTPRQRG